ncbi:uncharacterized protein [Palaemon carinicauda]|uniref:uncharacterized protein n=1 Tax=Palaemon carinicauda TaxID=392227 RepID=UPI0035B609E7
MNAVGHRRSSRDVPERRQSCPPPTYATSHLHPNQQPLQPLSVSHQPQLCYYHCKFEAGVKKCANSCQWPKNVKIGHHLSRWPPLSTEYIWNGLIADVTLPILGVDFFSHFHLLVDVAHQQLVNADSYFLTPIQPRPYDLACHIRAPTNAYSHLLTAYTEVFRLELRQMSTVPTKHEELLHHLRIALSRQQQNSLVVRYDKYTFGEEVLLLGHRITHGVHPLPKKVYHTNKSTSCPKRLPEPVRAVIPNVDILLMKVLMTKVNTPMDSHITTFQTSINISTPDEVDNYSTLTEADMNAVEHRCSSRDIPERRQSRPPPTYATSHLHPNQQPLQPLSVSHQPQLCYSHCKFEAGLRKCANSCQWPKNNSLVVQYDKYTFGKKVSLLGDIITHEGVHPLPKKVVAVQNFPMPSTVKAQQEFLGMINYYHRFLPTIAATFAPLYASLKGKQKDLKWGLLQEVAFRNPKNAQSTTTALSFPVPYAYLLLSTNASNVAIRVVLVKVVNSSPRPLAFFSRKLSKAESSNSTFDKEFLPVHLAVHHFHHFLEGMSFVTLTEHIPLVHTFT